MRNRCFLFLVLGFLVFPASAQAKTVGKDARLGLGVGFGTLMSGVSVKQYLSPTTAVQGLFGNSGFGLGGGADIVLTQATLWRNRDATIRWGVGAGIGFTSRGFLGGSGQFVDLTAVLELVLHIKSMPLEITTDFRPGILRGVGAFSSSSFLHLGGGGGAIRWYF
ncbi:MAG: hypothetical protein OSB21_07955 [Myxococcota bacterium]|nr:hypothetical protein [Myxococcota bacterium]